MEKHNLQARLGLIMLVFFVIALAGAVLRAVILADDLIAAELESSASLLDRLFTIAELDEDSPFNPGNEPAFLRELVVLENIRHIDITLESRGLDYPQLNSTDRADQVPAWFVRAVTPDTKQLIRQFTQSNGDIISIYADPLDEIVEIWRDTRDRLIANFLFLLVLFGVVAYFTRRWIGQLETVAQVLDNVEQGDFSRRVRTFDLHELRQVGDRINRLTSWLGSSKSENERLTRKSIMVQEHERRFLAQELHDSLGQAVSAIKAIAVSIEERSRQTDPTSAKSAKNIEEIANSAYASVRKLMASLRPQVLDELGLVAGLNQMVDDWNLHHEDTFCRLRLDGEFATLHEEQQINLYRIIQEALTNISKYARAETVSITLSGNEIISLHIIDDGVGFVMSEITQSMGLTGIRDRVTLLRGAMEIASKPGKGVSIQIEFPRMDNFRRRVSDR